jgi:acetyl esterase/lipase
MAALTPGDPAFQPGFEDVDTSVTAAVCLYGYYGALRSDGRPPTRPSTPMAHVGPEAPPCFVAHGDRDTYVAVEGARRFAAALRAASSSPVVYAELPGAQHAFDLFHSLRFDAVVSAVEAFAAWTLSTRPHGSGTHVP